jgi:uncharacterized repeat protein (TIGR01451 family)
MVFKKQFLKLSLFLNILLILSTSISNSYAAQTPDGLWIMQQGSGVLTSVGDITSACDTSSPVGFCSYYRYFIEVPPGNLSNPVTLAVDIFDADVGAGPYEDTAGLEGRDRRYDPSWQSGDLTRYSLIDPAGNIVATATCGPGSGTVPPARTNACSVTGIATLNNVVTDNTWARFATITNPANGHWELRVDSSSTVTTNNFVNAYGIHAYDTSGGQELNMYSSSNVMWGQNPDNVDRIFTAFPYITQGTSFYEHDFDVDDGTGYPPGDGGWLQLMSRTGITNITQQDLSGNNVWHNQQVNIYMTDYWSADYGIWQENFAVKNYLANNGNYGNFFNSYSSSPPTGPYPTPGCVITSSSPQRMYYPSDSGGAPQKPYMEQQLSYKSGYNPPAVNQTTVLTITLKLTNPTAFPVTFTPLLSPQRVITTNVPGGEVLYGGNATVTQGTIVSQPTVNGSGNIVWDPGVVSANTTVTLSYDVNARPTTSAKVLITGSGATGATAVFVDETQDFDNACATVSFGPLGPLAVTQGSQVTKPILKITKSGPSQVALASLTVNANNTRTITVDNIQLFSVGQVILVNGTQVTISAINTTNKTITWTNSWPRVTAAIGAAVSPTFTFTITYQNLGSVASTSTVITDVLDSHFTWVSGGSNSSGTVTWNIGTVNAGASGSVTVTVGFNTAGTYFNTATISSTQITTAVSSNSTMTTGAGLLQLNKTTSTPNVTNSASGTNATYTITLANPYRTAATNVVITDMLTQGFTYLSTTTYTGCGGTPASPVAGVSHPQWTCTSLAAYGTITITFIAHIDSSVVPGTYNNAVKSTTDNVAVMPFDETATTAENVTVTVANDLGITKSVQSMSDPCDEGSCQITYALSVKNLGTSSAANTVVTDVLPSQLTFSSASNGGTYNSGNRTVTWNLGTVSAGATVNFTLTVTLNTYAATVQNCAAVTTTSGDSNSANNTGCTTFLPTLVLVSGFGAFEENGQVIVRWETTSEYNTLGFNLLRLDTATGEYRQVNSGLLPALLTPHRGGTYTLRDSGASAGGVYTYKLIEVEIGGNQLVYGPFTVMVGRNILGERSDLSAASDYSRKGKEQSAYQLARVQARKAILSGKALTSNQRASVKPSAASSIKISVFEEGMYYLDAQDISSLLGISLNSVKSMIGQSRLSLSNQGNQVSYLPADNNSGLYFYGTAIDSQYTRENVYWLDSGNGTLMSVVQGTGPTPVPLEGSFTETKHFEEDMLPWETLFNDPDADYWFWGKIFTSSYHSDPPQTFNFQITGLSADQPEATLQVQLFGGSDAGKPNDHHVKIYLNGDPAPIAEEWWDGQTFHTITASAVIKEGQNTITVEGLCDDGISSSFVLIDSFDVTYQRVYEANGDKLFFRGNGSQPLTAGGFTSSDIKVFDISDILRPKFINSVAIDTAAKTVSLNPTANTRYVAAASGGIATPSFRAVKASKLSSKSNKADYLVIAPEELVSTTQILADYRKGQKLKTMVVSLEDIMDVFNYGIMSPEAIKKFLSFAYSSWKKAPRYVVLAGDGSMDYKNNLGYGGNLIPSKMVSTLFGLAMSDNYLADVNGDHLPEIAIGRLPVMDSGELLTVINKIKTYEHYTGKSITLLADTPDNGGEFITDSEEIATIFPSGYPLNRLYLHNPALIDDVRTALFNALNGGGTGFLNYVGHAGTTVFSSAGLLSTDDLPLLTNATKLPVMAAMTCVTGNFSDPYEVVLSEALVLKSGGGVAAVWSPTGQSDDTQAKILDSEFYKAILSGKKKVLLGDAVLQALTVYRQQGSMPFMMDMYGILGDPALRIR